MTATFFKRGFTIVEILVVISVIGVISSAIIAMINPSEQLARTRDAGRKAKIKTIGDSLQSYAIINGNYPLANGSWMTSLVSSGSLKAPIAAVPGNKPCTDNPVNGFCYNLVGSIAYVYTYSESAAEAASFTEGVGGESSNVFFGFDSSSGNTCARGGDYQTDCGVSVIQTPTPTLTISTPTPSETPTPTIVPPTPTPTLAPNMLLNASFETNNAGKPANWSGGAWDNTVARTGAASMRFDTGTGVYSYQKPSLLPSTTYTFRGWVKTNNIAGGNGGTMRYVNVPGSVVYSTSVSGTSNWTFISKTFTTQSDWTSSSRLDIYVYYTSGTGPVWYDDVSMCLGSGPCAE